MFAFGIVRMRRRLTTATEKSGLRIVFSSLPSCRRLSHETVRSLSLLAISRALDRLDDHSGSVSQHFGDAAHHLVGVVPGSDDGIGADLGSVLNHDFKSLASRLLAKLREECDVTTDERLQASAERAEYRTGTHRNAAHDAQVSHDAEPGQFKRGCDHVMRDRITRRRDGIGRLSVDLIIHTSISGRRQPSEPSVRFLWRMNFDGSHASPFHSRKQNRIFRTAALVCLEYPQDDRFAGERAAQTFSIPIAAFFAED